MPARPISAARPGAERPAKRRPAPTPHEVTSRLLRHFRKHSRDLPWRGTTDPYAVWLSETMLQQTQVATVIPFYLRWMNALPDLQSVARAPLDRLLQLWAGLGYYTRPRRFQEAAREILETRSGQWPTTPDAWQSLPGIGRYTAGAVCSIAFNQPTPVVDGNIKRVLSRVWGLSPGPGASSLTRTLWQLADQLVQAAAARASRGRRNCSDLNQALMELGALVCKPRKPRCASCPLARLCVARGEGDPARYPRPASRPPATRLDLRIWILDWRGRTYLERQSGGEWNVGLWQFPTELAGVRNAKNHPGAPRPRPAEKPLFSIHHSITRHRIRAHVFGLRGVLARDAAPSSPRGRWHSWNEIPRLALPGLHRKIYDRWRSDQIRVPSKTPVRNPAPTPLPPGAPQTP